MFDEKVEGLKLAISGTAAGLINVLGGNHKYIVMVCVLMLCDTVLGWLKAKKLGEWNSKAARWGAAGKVVELMLIALMHMLDWVLDMNCLMSISIFYYGIVEISSMLENINDGGLTTLPPGFVEVIRKLKFSAGTIFVKKIKDMIHGVIGINVDSIKNDDGEDKND